MRFALLAAAAALCVSSLAAHADNFAFSFSGAGGGISGSGTLTATNYGSYDQITAIQGGNPSMGLTITGLVGVNGYDGNDNKLLPNGTPAVDGDGFAFTASQINPNNQGNTSYEIRLYAVNAEPFLDLTDSDGYSNGAIPANLSVTSTTPASVTPEPSSIALLGTGLLGVAGVVRRRFV